MQLIALEQVIGHEPMVFYRENSGVHAFKGVGPASKIKMGRSRGLSQF